MFTIQRREDMNFKKYVIEHFNFLIEEFNFSILKIDNYKADFSRNGINVAVYHERLSYEIYLTVSLYGKTYYLNEVLNWKGIQEQQKVYQAVNEQAVSGVLSKMSALLRQYCINVITLSKKDADVVTNILETQRQYNLQESGQRAFFSAASIAWKAKDYKRFVQLFEGYDNQLSHLQQKQLSYARRIIESEKNRDS